MMCFSPLEKRRSRLLDFLVVNRGHRGRATTLPGIIHDAYNHKGHTKEVSGNGSI